MTPSDEKPDVPDADSSSNPSMSEITIVGGPRVDIGPDEVCLRRLGRYELLEEVGRGSFARVYRARDPRLNREVAVKALRTEYVDDAHMIARVYREARAAAQLRHPAIVPVYEVAEDGGQAYIVTEFVAGGTLDDVLKAGLPEFGDAARSIARIADALHYAHQYGVVHRDVKPANIMTNDAGDPMVADFGLAMHVDAEMTLSEAGGVVGTPAYMAPEQAGGAAAVDGRADVYALGVVLYRMLTGRLPFEGAWTATLHMVMSVEPPRPRSIRSAIPVDLETITMRAMAKEPARRYPTAAAFADDLRRYLEHLPVRARRRGPLGRVALWARRNPLVAFTIVAATVLVAIVAAAAFVRVSRERDLFLDQRDESNANLYRALLGEAAALSQSRETGWRWRVLDNVEAAGRLDVRDAGELRRVAIEALGTTEPCLRAHRTLDGHPGPIAAVAVSDRFAVTVAADGMRTWRVPDGQLVAGVFGRDGLAAGQFVRDVAAFTDGVRFASVDDAGRLRVWRVDDAGVREVSSVDVAAPLTVAVSREDVVAVGGADGRVRVGRAAGSDPAALEGSHGGAVVALSFDEPSGRLASAGLDLAIRVHDLQSGSVEAVLPVIDPPTDVVLSGGHVWVSSIPAYGVLKLDLAGGRTARRRLHDGGVPAAVRDGSGGIVTIGHDGAIKNVDGALADLAVGRADAGDGLCVAVSPDGGWVIAGYDRGRAILWQRSILRIRRAARGSHRLGWLPDGRLFGDRFVGTEPLTVSPLTSCAALGGSGLYATADADGTVVLRELRGGLVVADLPDDARRPAVVASSPTGASWSRSLGSEVVVFDGVDDEGGRTVVVGEGIDRIVHGPGRTLAVRSAAGISLLDLDRDDPLVSRHPPGEFAFTDSLLVTASGGVLTAHDVVTGVAQAESGDGGRGNVVAMACDPRSESIVVVRADGSLDVFADTRPTSGPTASHEGLPDDVLRVVSDSEAWHAVVIRAGGRAEVWDLDEGRRLAELHRVAATDAAFLDDEHVVLTTSNGEVRGFAVASLLADRRASLGGDEVATNAVFTYRRCGTLIDGGHPDVIWGTAASADGSLLATCGHDSTTKLWDVATRRLLRTIRGHRGVAWSVAFTADGRRVATGSGGRVVVSEVESGVEVASLDAHGGLLVSGVAFSPDGTLLATAGYDGTARLWDLARRAETAVLARVATSVHDVAFSPDGRRLLVAANDERVRIYAVDDPGMRAAIASDDVEDVEPLRVIPLDSAPWAVCFDRSSDRIAAACEDGSIRIWSSPRATDAVRLDCDARLLRSVAFDPAGERIAAGAFAGGGVVWDLSELDRRLTALGVPAW